MTRLIDTIRAKRKQKREVRDVAEKSSAHDIEVAEKALDPGSNPPVSWGGPKSPREKLVELEQRIAALEMSAINIEIPVNN